MIPPAALAFLSKYGIWLAIAAAVAGVLTLAYCKGERAGGQKEVNHQLERTVATERKNAGANEAAELAREADRLTIADQKKELDDAVAQGEDPDALRHRRGCLVLRQQGRDTASLPQCQRFEAGD